MLPEIGLIPWLLGGAVGFVFGVGGFFLGEVEAGFWVLVGTEKMDRNFCAGMLAFKQGVEGFEEDGFEAGGQVGKFGFSF